MMSVPTRSVTLDFPVLGGAQGWMEGTWMGGEAEGKTPKAKRLI